MAGTATGGEAGAATQRVAGSLLGVADLSVAEVGRVLALAGRLERMDHAERSRLLAGRRVALLFYESSTRTRTSFELAAKGLGLTTTLVSDKSSSIEKGESLKDTGLTLRALGAECIILRHANSGAPWVLERAVAAARPVAGAGPLPVLNAGDGTHEHPSQALLDLRTMLERLPELAGRVVDERVLAGVTVAITGDILHSRVARSNAMLLPRLGARVILCGPEELLPEEAMGLADGLSAGAGTLELERDFERAIEQAGVVMMLRIQRERLRGLELDLDDYMTRFQFTAERLRRLAPEALVLHPGPMIRGLEIEDEVADGPQSAIEEQVRQGLWLRSALLVRALAGDETMRRLLGEVWA